MASPESIEGLLRAASALLDRAAGEIREAPLQPVRANVTKIGKALAEVAELQLVIWQAHPHLRPDYMNETPPDSEANRLLTVAMGRAVAHEENRNLERAISIYREFLTQESTPHHQAIARAEIDRLVRKCDD